jgi:hypothetical protein
MAVIIGRTKGWVWWLAGLFCALLFGSQAGAAEAVALYGVRVGPEPVEAPPATEAEKKQAGELVDAWLSAGAPAEPSDEERKAIAALIADLGAKDFAAREAASAGLVKLGPKAAGQLREAAKAGDPEVAQRAGKAIADIEAAPRQKVVEELRKVRAGAQAVLGERIRKEQDAAKSAAAAAEKLEAEGRKDDAAAKRAEAEAAGRRRQELVKLNGLVLYGAMVPGGEAKYGVRPVQLR